MRWLYRKRGERGCLVGKEKWQEVVFQAIIEGDNVVVEGKDIAVKLKKWGRWVPWSEGNRGRRVSWSEGKKCRTLSL